MFRSANGKILRRMFDHCTIHDLSTMPSNEIELLFLLMSISGNSSSPSGGYGFNGCMQINFADAPSAIAALRSRNYLVDTLPLDEVLSKVTVAELKELLKSHGLRVSGKRVELLERIMPALTDADIAALHAAYDFWLPSDYGYEMIYSLYDLWERYQLDLLNAIASRNRSAIQAAYIHMPASGFRISSDPDSPNKFGIWDNSPNTRILTSDIYRRIFEVNNPNIAFVLLTGFKPEFNIRELPEIYAVRNEPKSFSACDALETSESREKPEAYSKDVNILKRLLRWFIR